MNTTDIRNDILEQISKLPVIDVHTHLIGGKLAAQGLHDIVLYHMAISDLYAAGCPSGARLTQYPGTPSREEINSRMKEALPYLNLVKNTGISWGIRIILKDLYGWTEDITESNWEKLDAIIREKASDQAWAREIIKKSGIVRFGTEIARREQGQDDDILEYALEWAFFTRSQWGEFDTALYELERCWGELPGPPMPIGAGGRPSTKKVIRTLEDAREAVAWYVDHIDPKQVLSMATHISTDIDFKDVSDAEMADALKRRDSAGPAERDIYASYINEIFLTDMEKKLGDKIVYQFSFAAEPLPFETASRLSQKTIAQVAEMIARHPKLRFSCFLSSRHTNQSMCTLVRELPNLSLAAYWWHNFFPNTMRQIFEERLDMLPINKQIGFFSDAYCVDWAYGKLALVRGQVATVLADKVAVGQYTVDEAVEVFRQTTFETPQSLLGLTPAK